MWNAGLDGAQAGIKIAGRDINNLRYADNITLRAEHEEELKTLLSEKGEWKTLTWELDREQQTGSKLRKECIKAV